MPNATTTGSRSAILVAVFLAIVGLGIFALPNLGGEPSEDAHPIPSFSPLPNFPAQRPEADDQLVMHVTWQDGQVPSPDEDIHIILTYHGEEYYANPPRITFARAAGHDKSIVERTWLGIMYGYDGSPVVLEVRAPRRPNAMLTCSLYSRGYGSAPFARSQPSSVKCHWPPTG